MCRDALTSKKYPFKRGNSNASLTNVDPKQVRRTLGGYNALEVFFGVLAVMLAMGISTALLMLPFALLATIAVIALNVAKRRFVARYAAYLAASLKRAAFTPHTAVPQLQEQKSSDRSYHP